MQPQLTWDIAGDIAHLFDFPFMVNAFLAGSVVAVVASLTGWFMVMRRQTFVGHTLAVLGFPGAAGAALVGTGAVYGSLVFCVAAAAVLAAPRGGGALRERPALTGMVQAFGLSCGWLFVGLYGGNLNGVVAPLFGSFLGISDDEVLTITAGGLVVLGSLAVMARPLLFASIDPGVARARGLRVGAIGFAFLLLLGISAAEADQITGALLVFALLVLPAATAQAITAHPAAGMALSVAIGIGITWIGLALAYYTPVSVVGFWVTTPAFVLYAAVRVVPRLAAVRPRRWPVASPS